MSDQEREPTPEQEAEVSRLLAEARATEPLPAELAARLERVLVGLGEERAPATPGHVVALAGRRRRATVLMVAAAAVVAVGVGLGQIVDSQTDGSDDSAGAGADSSLVQDEGADRKSTDADGEEGAAPEVTAEDPQATPSGDANFESSPPLTDTAAGRVRKDNFSADANQLRRAIPDGAIDGEFVQLADDQLPQGYVLDARTFDCAPADWGPGVLVPVLFDGKPAVLAYRPVTGESQVVDLLQCGSGNRLRSTTLQAG